MDYVNSITIPDLWPFNFRYSADVTNLTPPNNTNDSYVVSFNNINPLEYSIGGWFLMNPGNLWSIVFLS
jgi:hypothetical protein